MNFLQYISAMQEQLLSFSSGQNAVQGANSN